MLEPLSAERYRLTLTVSAALRDQIERARTLMRHANLRGDLEPILERAMALLIEKLEKTKLGKTKRARKSRGTANPSDVSRATRREVYERDTEQCTYVSPDGERCPAVELLELDHSQPRAFGGPGDALNLHILCRAHNRRAAENVFGREYIESRIHLRRRKSGVTEAAEPVLERVDLRERPAGSSDAIEPRGPTGPTDRERVRFALVAMGFRVKDAERAVDAIDVWSRPLEALVRDALDRLAAS